MSTETSCKEIVATRRGSPEKFWILSEWHGPCSFSISITNVQGSWREEGVKAQQGHAIFSEAEWCAHAKEALHDPSPAREFTYTVSLPQDPDSSAPEGTMQLWWAAEYEGEDGLVNCFCTLTERPDCEAMLAPMLSQLCESYKVFKGAMSSLESHSSELKRLLGSAQEKLGAQIKKSEEREADLFVKFTLLLNSKKQAIQQLTDRLAAAEAKVEQLSDQLAEAEAAGPRHEDGEDREKTEDEEEPEDVQSPGINGHAEAGVEEPGFLSGAHAAGGGVDAMDVEQRDGDEKEPAGKGEPAQPANTTQTEAPELQDLHNLGF